MPWFHKIPDLKNDPSYLEPRITQTETDVANKTEGYLNLEEYNPIGDGVTDDTQAIKDAITYAKSNNLTIRVPNKTYLITSELGSFWDVRFEGAGKLKFDNETWYFDIQYIETNTIYVSETTGLNTNSGISSTSPVRTLSKVHEILKSIGDKAQKGRWKVRLLGSFTDGQTFDALPDFAYPLIFEGDKNADGTPATNITYTSGKSQFGMRFEPARQISVYNINFKDFKVGFNGYGLIAKDHGNVFVDNCTADNCDIGFAFINNCIGSIRGSKATNCTNGFNGTYSSSVTFGYNGKPAEAINCGTGFYISRSAIAHVDYCIATDATVAGVHIDVNARAHILGTNFKRNAIGVRVDGGGEWNNNTSTPNTFNDGTADANTINYAHYGGGRETRMYSTKAQVENRVASVFNDVTHTGVTGETNLYSGGELGALLPPNFFKDDNKRLRFVVRGTAVGTGNKTLIIRSTDSQALSSLIVGGLTFDAAGDFVFESVLVPNGSASQKRYSTVHSHMGATEVYNTTCSMDATKERWFRVNADLGVSTDSITITSVEVFLMG